MSTSYVGSLYLFVGVVFTITTVTVQAVVMEWTGKQTYKFLQFLFFEIGAGLFFPWAIGLGAIAFLLGHRSIRRYALMLYGALGFLNFLGVFYYYVIRGQGLLIRDLVHHSAAQLWLWDFVSVCVIGAIFVLAESLRYFPGFFRILGVLFAFLLLGFDTVLPIFFVYLETIESSPYKRRTNWSDLAWLYLVLGALAFCVWSPSLLRWSIEHGNVSDQLFLAWRYPASNRVVIAILIGFFATLTYTLPQISFDESEDPMVNKFVTWILRIAYACLVSWHVGAGLAVFLMFRELTPNRTFQVVHRIKVD